jgi:UDP-3-O-[3-hydroxymyristoyl] glucosamine N-acyltransferase
MPRETGLKLTVRELAGRLGCPFAGDGDALITGVGSLEGAKAGELVFLAHPRHRPALDASAASAAVIPSGEDYGRIPVIKSPDPHFAFARAIEIFYEPDRPAPGVHPLAAVSPSAKIGEGASIGPLSWIGDGAEIGAGAVIHALAAVYPGVRIGEGSVIHSHASIREGTSIGKRVVIHDGVVIGADGFRFLKAADGRRIKIPQVGRVVIEDDVEIGSNSAVDRAALDATVIRRGAKLDDLVMVGHNVEIGENAVLVAQVGIAGSSSVGREAILSGQVGVADHITIGDGAVVAAKTGVARDVPAGAMVAGIPNVDIREWRKFWAAAPRLYDLVKEVKRLRERVEKLEK